MNRSLETLPNSPNIPETVDRDIIEAVKIEDDIAQCRHCDLVLGRVEGRYLRCGLALLTKKTPIRCAVCKRRNVWKPKNQNEVDR
jgi:hypothetical protein